MKVFGFISGTYALSAGRNAAFIEQANTLITKEQKVTQDQINKAEKVFAAISEELTQEISNSQSIIGRDTEDKNIQAAALDAANAKGEASQEALDKAEEKKATAEANLQAANNLQEKYDRIQTAKIDGLQQELTDVSSAKDALAEHINGLEVKSFMQTAVELLNKKNPSAVAVASSQEGSELVIGMLEDLKDSVKAEATDAVRELTNAKSAHAMKAQELNDEIAAEKKRSQNAQDDLAAANQAAAKAQTAVQNLSEAISSQQQKMSKDKTELKSTTQKNEEFMTDHNEQMSALNECMSIIKSKIDGSFLQIKGVSLVQLHSGPEQASRVAAYLSKKADDLKSNILSALATQVAAGGPFKKVVDMISKLLERLNQEAADEAGANGKCTAQKAALDADISSLNKDLNKDQANTDTFRGDIEDNEETILNMQNQIEQANNEIAKRDENRAEQKTDNEETIAETQEALDGIRSILDLIRDQMTGAAQTRLKPTFSAMQEQYTRTKVRTTQSEKDAERNHRSKINDLKNEKAADSKTLEITEKELAGNKLALNRAEEDKESHSKTLKTKNHLLALNQKQCNNVMSHEEKMAKMKSEIQSLKEALEILREV